MLRASELSDVRLGHREGRPDLALQERVQPPLLLLGGAEQHQGLHVAGVRRPAVDGLGGDDRRPAGDLRDGGVLEVGQPGELVVEQVPQAPLARLGLQLLEDRWRGVVVVAAGGAPLLVDRLGREDMLAHEVPHPAGRRPRLWRRGRSPCPQRSGGRDPRRSGVAPEQQEARAAVHEGRRTRAPGCCRPLAAGSGRLRPGGCVAAGGHLGDGHTDERGGQVQDVVRPVQVEEVPVLADGEDARRGRRRRSRPRAASRRCGRPPGCGPAADRPHR